MGVMDQLEKGSTLPALHLGEGGCLGAWRGRRNLVLFLTHPLGCSSCTGLLRDLAANLDLLRGREAEVLAMVPGDADEVRALVHRLGLPFPICAVREDELGSDATLVVTDRFGEVFAMARSGDDHRLLTVAQLAEELAFVELQCPE